MSLQTTSWSLALTEPARRDRYRRGCSSQAQHTQQHLRRLRETCPSGAEVFGGRQALPSQLLQVITLATVCLCDYTYDRTYFNNTVKRNARVIRYHLKLYVSAVLDPLCCHCFRCTECHSTLLPGAYKSGSSSRALVCTHHVTRHVSANQNGRPDLSKGPAVVQSARVGRSTVPHSSLSAWDQMKTVSPVRQTNETNKSENDFVTVPTVTPNKADSLEKANDIETGGETVERPRSSSPPNPFDESDEEEKTEEETQTPATLTANGDVPSTPVSHHDCTSRPVPAPRRVSDPTPPPRPAPRVRVLCTAEGWWFLIADYQ